MTKSPTPSLSLAAGVAEGHPTSETLALKARAAVEKLAYSPAEAAAALGVTRAHVYNLVARGELPMYHLGRAARIPVSAIRAIVGAQ